MSKLFENTKGREVLVKDDEKSFRFQNKGHIIKVKEILVDPNKNPRGKVIKEKINPNTGISKEVKQTDGEYLRKGARVVKHKDSLFYNLGRLK